MRRFLQLLCVAALTALTFGGPSAAALQPTWLVVVGSDVLLNENGDGYWDTATVRVHTDADEAHWVLASGARTIAQGDLTPSQLREAGNNGLSFPVSSATAGGPLSAGTYTFTVTATSTGEDPATDSAHIHVSTAPPLAAMAPSAAVIYPRDHLPGVAHEITFRHRLDPTILEWGAWAFEVVGPDGAIAGPISIDPDDPLLRWNGQIWSSDEREFVLAPTGTYRARLVLHGYGSPRGPLSEPFRVSPGYRVERKVDFNRSANATRTGTLTVRKAQLRIQNGVLRYRALNRDWRVQALVRTAHRVAVPINRVPGAPVRLVVRGRWQDFVDIDLEVVTASGRVRNIDEYNGVDSRTMTYTIPSSLIRSDGSVRFRLLWTSHGRTGAPGRIGQTDTVGVQISRYFWQGLG